MKTLILMRHAKSSWSTPGLDDHDRPLNKRGRKAAPLMAQWLAARGLIPDRILCSTARRVRETIEAMRAQLHTLPMPDFHEALYHAAPEALHGHALRLPDACACALVIGHEPGLSSYARRLGGATAPEACQRAYAHCPTAAVAVFQAEIVAWPELAPAVTDFVDFAVPREVAAMPRGPG